MPLILLWIVLPIIVIWGIYKIIRLFVLTGESVYEAKKENKEFASYLAKEPEWPPQTAPPVAGQTAPGRTHELCLNLG